MNNPIAKLLLESINNDPQAKNLRPEFRTADGDVDVDKMVEKMYDITRSFMKSAVEQIGREDLASDSKIIEAALDAGEFPIGLYVMQALSNPGVRAILIQMFERELMAPDKSSAEVVH